MSNAFVYDAVRTPFGKFNGGLAGVRPDDLAATVLGAVRDRTPGLDPESVDEVILGNANGAGEENRNVARMATLLAGFPVSVPGSTVNRLCGSSLDAAMAGSRMIETGDAEIVLTGGVESMTRAPWVLPKPSRALPRRQPRGRLDDARLAAGQPGDALGVDGVARRGQRAAPGEVRRVPRAPGRLRRPVARPRRPGMERRLLRRPRRCGPGIGPRPGRVGSDRVERRVARQAQAVVPQGRHHHRGQRLAAERRRLGRAARVRAGCRLTGSAPPSRGSRVVQRMPSSRSGSATPRSRQPRRPSPGPGSAGPTSARSSSTRPSRCSRWSASTRGRSTPRS